MNLNGIFMGKGKYMTYRQAILQAYKIFLPFQLKPILSCLIFGMALTQMANAVCNATTGAGCPANAFSSGTTISSSSVNSNFVDIWSYLGVSSGVATTGLPIAAGGTGSTTASGAQANLGMGFILVQKLSASNSTELDFTSCFSSSYDEYLIEVVSLIPGTNGAAPLLQFSTDGGSTYDTSAIYDWSMTNILLGAATTGTNNQANVNGIVIFGDSARVGLLSTGAPGLAANFRIFDPLSSSVNKIVYGQGMGHYSANSSRYSYSFGGVYKSTTAVNAFRIIMTSGNIASGAVRCYGAQK